MNKLKTLIYLLISTKQIVNCIYKMLCNITSLNLVKILSESKPFTISATYFLSFFLLVDVQIIGNAHDGCHSLINFISNKENIHQIIIGDTVPVQAVMPLHIVLTPLI